MSDLQERVLREGYAWYMRDDGITPDTPLTDALVELYEAVVSPGESDGVHEFPKNVREARDRITKLLEGDD